jgi:type VI secretion system protein ImpA
MNPAIDITTLLEPIAAASPCGADLEYTAEFAALQVTATAKPEQQVGATIVPASGPDWHDVVERSASLLKRTHDLRIACRLTQALLHVSGVPGLSAGLALVRGYLLTRWDALYPRPDADDDHDPAIRVNALALLCNVGAIIHPLRERTLLHSSIAGAVSLRSIARASGAEAAAENAGTTPGMAEIEAAFDAMPLPDLQALVSAATQARQDASTIESELARRVGSAKALDFDALIKALAEIETIAAPRLARRAAAAAERPAEDIGEAPAGEPEAQDAPALHHGPTCIGTPNAKGARGPLRNRADVLQALRDTCRYFEQHEPCHPVPILLERAQRWIAMDYMALLRDLAPEAAAQAEKLRGASL